MNRFQWKRSRRNVRFAALPVARDGPGGDDCRALGMGPRVEGGTCFDERQLAALCDSRDRGYLHLPYRDVRESIERRIFSPLVNAWEHALNEAGAAVIVMETFADTWLAKVTYSAVASQCRLEPDSYRSRGIAELEKLVRPVLGERAAGHEVPVQLWWFTNPLPFADAEDLATRAVVIDRCFYDATHPGVFDLFTRNLIARAERSRSG